MKKITYIPLILALSVLVDSSAVLARSPALVPSIRGEALLGVSLPLDADKSELFVYATSADTQEPPSVIEVTGVMERLEIGSTTQEIVSTIEEIQSQDDLKNYIKVLIRNNPDLTSVRVNGNSIIMVRTISGKFLGLVTLPVQETAEVTHWDDGASEVTISSPWWNIFSNTYTDTEITKNLYVKIKTIPTPLFGESLDLQTQGRILTQMDSTFNEHTGDTTDTAK